MQNPPAEKNRYSKVPQAIMTAEPSLGNALKQQVQIVLSGWQLGSSVLCAFHNGRQRATPVLYLCFVRFPLQEKAKSIFGGWGEEPPQCDVTAKLSIANTQVKTGAVTERKHRYSRL